MNRKACDHHIFHIFSLKVCRRVYIYDIYSLHGILSKANKLNRFVVELLGKKGRGQEKN